MQQPTKNIYNKKKIVILVIKNKNQKKKKTFSPKNKNTIIIHKCSLVCVGQIESTIEHRIFLRNQKLTMKKMKIMFIFSFQMFFPPH